MRLPAYDPARAKATQPHNLVANYVSFRLVGRKSKARPLGYLMGLIYFLTNEFSKGKEQGDEAKPSLSGNMAGKGYRREKLVCT